MDCNCCKISIIAIVAFLFVISLVSSVQSVNVNNTNRNLDQRRAESEKLKHIREYLKKINKPAVKTIQSPDGDLIDCVLFHLQPAFDHPLLKGQKPMDPPEIPKWPTSSSNETMEENIQVWTMSGETCPENTVPIRRTTEQDVLRASSVQTFGRKPMPAGSNSHEHAISYKKGKFYGAAAIMEVWAPYVENPGEFSLAQIWIMAGTFEQGDLNTIETGWQVFHSDGNPRLFTYWTRDAYDETGCYNSKCPGFVQISKTIVPGGAIAPVSSYKKRYELAFKVHKVAQDGDWWLIVNNEGVGYWPSILFTHLKDGPADMIQFGGEITNSKSPGAHTKTQMGSGHFPSEGYGKAAAFKQLEAYDSNNNPVSIPQKQLMGYFDNKKCYWAGTSNRSPTFMGTFFLYGGPGGAAPGCN